MKSTRVWRAVLTIALLAPAAVAFPQAKDFTYVRKNTREASRAATLAQYVPHLEPGDWSLIGPLAL